VAASSSAPVPADRRATLSGMSAGTTAEFAPGVTRLRRSPYARLFAGCVFQPLLTMGMAILLVTLVGLAWFGGFGAVLSGAAPGLPWVAAWLVGVTAHAEVDEAGVRWRYYRTGTLGWADVERVRLGVLIPSGGWGPQAAMWVRVGSRDHVIAPALGCSRKARVAFGQALVAQARAHKVRVEIPRNDPRWSDVARRAA
jgi:hypothetical protein